MTAAPDTSTAERLARIEVSLERIALVMEETLREHAKRLREVEDYQNKQRGVIHVLNFLGIANIVAILALALTLNSKGAL